MKAVLPSLLLSVLTFSSPPAAAQVVDFPPLIPAQAPERPRTSAASAHVAAGADYQLGPDDQVSIAVLQAPELNTTTRVSEQGFVSLSLIGAVQAGGRTAAELEAAIEAELGRKYIKNPDVSVQVLDVRSRPVSVMGAVQRPGIVQVQHSTTLLDVLSMAGGLTPEAGDTVVVVRKGGNETAAPIEIKLKALLEARDPATNLAVQAGDVVNVRAADVVYVVGAVNKPGAYAMRGNDRLTVLRALALGAGLAPAAAQGDALVVRLGPQGERVEIPVDLGAVLKGKQRDVALEAHDVLFVPTSGSKVAARTTLDAFVRILTWRPY